MGSLRAARAAPRRSCQARWSRGSRTCRPALGPLLERRPVPQDHHLLGQLEAPGPAPLGHDVGQRRRGAGVEYRVERGHLVRGDEPGAGAAIVPWMIWRSRAWPSWLAYQASSARSEVPHLGSTAQPEGAEVGADPAQGHPALVDALDLGRAPLGGVELGRRRRAHSGIDPMWTFWASTVSHRSGRTDSSPPTSLSRKVSAARARTRCSTIPAVGWGRTSSPASSSGGRGAVAVRPPRRRPREPLALSSPDPHGLQPMRSARCTPSTVEECTR